MRGYDRDAVDRFVAEMADLIETLESRQARETVVQHALEEVGKETSAILKQAHETADDITARSRSQAEDRAEVARQEASAITRDARIQAEELKRETEGLQVERANIIEELRRFASDTLALAEAAADRLDPSLPGVSAVDLDEPASMASGESVVDAPLSEGDEQPYDRADDLGLDEDWVEEDEELAQGEDVREDAGPPTEELEELPLGSEELPLGSEELPAGSEELPPRAEDLPTASDDPTMPSERRRDEPPPPPGL
jgi:hypothetical protein